MESAPAPSSRETEEGYHPQIERKRERQVLTPQPVKAHLSCLFRPAAGAQITREEYWVLSLERESSL